MTIPPNPTRRDLQCEPHEGFLHLGADLIGLHLFPVARWLHPMGVDLFTMLPGRRPPRFHRPFVKTKSNDRGASESA